MVFAVCGIGALFYLPFKYPKVSLSLGCLGALVGLFAWLAGNSDPLGSSDSVWWIPMFAGAFWIYRRWMDPRNRK
jgi:hypothetical protein